jgi:glycosyltransferase involved in cell wall biosynthesis
VLWLVKGLGRGGAEQLLLTVARELDPALIDAQVGYVLAHKNALVPDLAASGVEAHCLSAPGVPWPLALRRLVVREDFDVVHTHSPLVAVAARLLTPRRTVMLHTEHNMWDRYRWPSRLANALTLRRNRRVFAVSEGVARSMRPHALVRGVDLSVLVHGLGGTSIPAAPHARRHALERLGLEPGPFTVGCVGNLTAKKDHATLVRALVALRRAAPTARLVLVGGGPLETDLKALVRDLDLDDAVLLTGVRDDVPALLPAFDAYAMSSRYEGLSVALLEAMAAGVPPVVTRVGGMPEVIHDGRDGLLVAPGDPGALAAALAKLAADQELRATLAEAARRRARDFGIGPAVEALTDAYRSVRASRQEVAS